MAASLPSTPPSLARYTGISYKLSFAPLGGKGASRNPGSDPYMLVRSSRERTSSDMHHRPHRQAPPVLLAILPPWCRKTPKVTEVLPLLYLHGLSSGDFAPALGQFLGSSAGPVRADNHQVDRDMKAEQRAFAARDLSGVDYVYLWADGIHVNIRLQEHKLCLLVMIGVRADGRKELVALADGYRESAESGADLLRDCARPGMGAPVMAVGEG